MKKVCSVCHVPKRLSEFNKRRSSSNGRRSECRVCQHAASLEFRAEHGDQIATRKKARHVRIPSDSMATCRKCPKDGVIGTQLYHPGLAKFAFRDLRRDVALGHIPNGSRWECNSQLWEVRRSRLRKIGRILRR